MSKDIEGHAIVFYMDPVGQLEKTTFETVQSVIEFFELKRPRTVTVELIREPMLLQFVITLSLSN